MLLYQPAKGEIDSVIAQARNRIPYASARLARAAELLTDVAAVIDYDPLVEEIGGGWTIRSQTDAAIWYRVNPDGCACPDHQHHGATPQYFCKHRLAYFAYRRILSNQLHRRLLGNLKYAGERNRARLIPGSLLLETGLDRLIIVNYETGSLPRRVCFARWSEQFQRVIPASDRDYALLAEWLWQHRDFEHPEPIPAELPNAAEWQPQLDREQIHTWLKTGSVY